MDVRCFEIFNRIFARFVCSLLILVRAHLLALFFCYFFSVHPSSARSPVRHHPRITLDGGFIVFRLHLSQCHIHVPLHVPTVCCDHFGVSRWCCCCRHRVCVRVRSRSWCFQWFSMRFDTIILSSLWMDGYEVYGRCVYILNLLIWLKNIQIEITNESISTKKEWLWVALQAINASACKTNPRKWQRG